jgi:mRNA interferase RelE/StbE
MPQAWSLLYSSEALRNLKTLDRQIAERLTMYLEKRVLPLDDPRTLGKVLKGSRLGSYWRYRVGNYRIVVNILDQELVVLVMRLGDRKKVY